MILITFGRNVAKEVSSQKFFIFPPHALPEKKQKNENCVFFDMLNVALSNTQNNFILPLRHS